MGTWRTSSTVDASQLFKRSVMSGLAHATNFGRVVECEGHWFEALYEDGYYETLSWHDLSRVLACRTQRAMPSWRGWSRSAERKPTNMTEPASNRTQTQRVECLR